MSERTALLVDVATGVVLALLGAWVAVQSLGLGLTDRFGPGPGFLPLFLGSGLVAGGVLMSGRALASGRASAAVELPEPSGLVQVAAALVGLILAALAFEALGFALTSAALTFFSVLFLAGRSPVRAAGVAIGAAALAYLIFDVALGLRLPTGPIPLP